MPAVILAWLLKLPALAWGPIKRNPVAAVLVLLLIGQQVQRWQDRRENTALRQTVNSLRTELAEARGAMVKLAEAAKLKPDERATAEIPKPQYIPYPVDRPGPLRIEYIREPGRIETRVETITLPGTVIDKIIDTAPQSIIAEFTATRDIKAGEKFRLVAAMVAPGVYQPILELGAPVTVDVRTATPVDKIPTPTAPTSRWSGRVYGGYGTADRILTGLRVNYRLNRWDLEGQGECREMFTKDPADPTKTRTCGSTDFRLTAGLRF